MAADLHPFGLTYEEEDDDYIDMEVGSNSNLFCHPKSSPIYHPNEFEFQMFSSSSERETATSPADELFYKGKLLPLHLPPRLQMFEKLFQNSTNYDHNTQSFEEAYFSTTLTTTAYTTPTENTPFESCNISPSESPQVSKELNPDEYFSEHSTEAGSFMNDNPKKSWTKKLKLIKQSTIGSKLKASRAYVKSLFTKSSSSDQSSARKLDEQLASKAKVVKKTPFGQIQREQYHMPIAAKSFDKQKTEQDNIARHRRSFSGAIRRFSTTKSLSLSHSSSSFGSSSSSSSSSNSNRFHDSSLLKRSGSVSSDVESSIQGAIAHCKRSQQDFRYRKTLSEVGFCSLSTTRLVGCEAQVRPALCRG